MLTLFTIPKPFTGHVGDIQRNALASWTALGPGVDVVLVGDEAGVREAAAEAGAAHVGGLERNERGTPLLGHAFALVEGVAARPLRCFVNADIVLLDDFLPAVRRIAASFDRFLAVGGSLDLDLGAGADLRSAAGRAAVARRARAEGAYRGYAALDYFVFPPGLFGDLPPFLVGRACFDNWLVWRARQEAPVVDVSRAVTVVHQSHDYGHVPGGKAEAYYGEEARWNETLAGGRSRIYTLHDVSHRLYAKGPPVRYPGSAFRARERARVAKVKWEIRRATRPGPRARPEPRDTRVVGVFPEPTPYRSPLLDRVAAAGGVELSVLYAARTVAGRTWDVRPAHTHWVMRSVRVPGARRLLRHDYPVNPMVWRALWRLRPDVVVVSGWSTFAAQAAIAWCRLRRIPYLLVVESHDRDPRPPWRRAVKGGVVPAVVHGASGVLVTGSLARESMLARGADPERVRVFANTVDVEDFGRRAEGLAARRDELRAALGLEPGDVAVLCVSRLAPEKGLDTLVRAAARAGSPGLRLVVAGEGPERAALELLARQEGVRLTPAGDLPWERVVEAYVAADVFALLSRHEPWGVVVNEAAACGLPLLLSDAVGAAPDLVREGVNGRVVPAGDVAAAAAALAELAASPGLRAAWGRASRSIAAAWGYEPSVRGLVELVELATRSRRRAS